MESVLSFWNLAYQAFSTYQLLILAGLLALVLLQWVAIQWLFIQLHMAKEEVQKPHPDLVKIRAYESRLKLLEDQTDLIFEKLAEQKKEIQDIERESLQLFPSVGAAPQRESASIESSFVSMGEINLKKRLDALKSSLPTT